LLERDHRLLVRLWGRGLVEELPGVGVLPRQLTDPLGPQLESLARLLVERGAEAAALWGETVRPQGLLRFQQHFDAEDLAREYSVLGRVLMVRYERRFGLDLPGLEFLAQVVSEAQAAVQGAYSRALRSEEMRFKNASVMESVLQHVDLGIWVAEVDGQVSYATPPVGRLLGQPLTSLMGPQTRDLLPSLLRRLKAHHPDGRPFHADELPLFRALETRTPVREEWMAIQLPGREESVLELSATPIFEDGDPDVLAGAIQVMADRTESARQTRHLAEAYVELQRLQGRLLRRTRAQALGQLAQGAAHALNNYLNVLRLRVTLLRRDPKPEHLDALDNTVRQIGELVARLQQFSEPPPLGEQVEVGLDKVAGDALELVQSEMANDEPKVRLDSHLAAKAQVRADPGLLRELLVNLVLAARDRMPQGGTLQVSTRADGAQVTLEVEDQGAPYDSEELTRLFDPLKGPVERPQLSLLLAVTREQLRAWDGNLTCENLPEGKGGRFVLTLPQAVVQRSAGEVPPQVEHRPKLGAAPRRLLVVDDDAENARMLAEVLEEQGFGVRVANSAKEALALWDSAPFDVALLDAVMPDVSGWELARRLRERSPHVVLAMVTGLNTRGQSRSNLSLVDAVFQKPLQLEALDEFLERPHAGGEEAPAVH
jgi:signal transduction histidine kinase